MSQSRGPYKSQLFSTLNRHSQRLRDRLGTTVRHLKVMAEWSVQALIYPFYWLLHPQKWLGPVIGSGSSSSQPALAAAHQREDDDDLIPSDQPIQSVLATLQPWLLEPEDSAAMTTPTVGLTDDLRERIRESLTVPMADPTASATPMSPPALPGSPITLALAGTTPPPPTAIAHWGQQLKTLFTSRPDSAIVIQGIACRCGDRRLVLTTQDNLSLDVLSTAQQDTLKAMMRRELAHFHYQRRRQWALNQQQWRGIPLLNPQSHRVIAPLDWLWRGLYRWQARPEVPGPLIALAPPSLPPLPPLPQLQGWVEQTTTALAHHPVIEATVVKSQQVSYQLIESLPLAALPAPLRHLGEHFQQTLAQDLATQGHLPETRPDPFELRVLIQAAIAHFFGPSSHDPLPSAPDGDFAPQTPWLQWDELFAELPQPSLSSPLLSSRPAMVHARATASVTTNASPAPFLSTPTVADPWDEMEVDSFTVFSPPVLTGSAELTVSSPKRDLETAFDWIETQAQTMGYDKHILVWCLEWLDRLVYGLEMAIGRLWRWLRQRFGAPPNSSLSK